ncbi:MAG: hypothetical protein M3405_09120 [Acidobacteriota bacterium]|nr:hypothetical protein [Acidobacteriota bacterium]
MNQLQHKGINKTDNLKKNYKKPSIFSSLLMLPTASFYFLTVAIALVLFFIVWGVLEEFGDKSPWIYAGIFSSIILLSAVIARESVFRKQKFFSSAAVGYEDRYNKASQLHRKKRSSPGFSLQQNASILKQIEKYSKAARINKSLPEKHLEVFNFCEEYLTTTAKELKKAEIGSTKWGAIKNGRRKVKVLHKHHLISWAAIESRRLTKAAKISGSMAGKIETGQKATLVLESALDFYPENTKLLESIEVVNDFVSSIKISHWIEQAEKAEFKGNYKRAESNYQDALFYLAREDVTGLDKQEVAEMINMKIKGLKKLKSKN